MLWELYRGYKLEFADISDVRKKPMLRFWLYDPSGKMLGEPMEVSEMNAAKKQVDEAIRAGKLKRLD